MRILKGWTENERKELEKAKDNYFDSAIELIKGIVKGDDDCIFLTKRYEDESSDEDNLLARDIADFYCGNAKFSDKKYYVHLIKDDEYSYLNINPNGGAKLYNRLGLNGWKVKFTHDEVVAINPQLLLFEEEVEDDE